MSERFTPGPWQTWNDVHGVEDDRPGLVVMPESADCGDGRKYCIAGGGNVEANARLISAAPHMYLLLCGITDNLSEHYYDETIISDAVRSMVDEWYHVRRRINGEVGHE